MMEAAENGNLDELVKKCENRLGENIVRIMFAQLVNVLQHMQKTFNKAEVCFAVVLTEHTSRHSPAVFFFRGLQDAQECKAMGKAGPCNATIFQRVPSSVAEATKTAIGPVTDKWEATVSTHDWILTQCNTRSTVGSTRST